MFGNATFVLFCVGRLNIWFAMQALFSHTPSRAVAIGLTLQQGTLLLSFVSVGSFLCRLILIGVTHAANISIIAIAITCALMGAAFLAAIAFTSHYYVFVVQHVAVGMTLGITTAIYCIIIITIVMLQYIIIKTITLPPYYHYR